MCSLLTNHGQTACFDWLTTRSSLAVTASSLVSRTPREQRLVVKLSRCCRPFRCLVEEVECTPARCLCNLNAKNYPSWFQEGKALPPPFPSRLAKLQAPPTPYRSRATVAAFRVPLTRYRPRRVVAVDHTVTMGCSPRPDVSLSYHRAALRFWLLVVVQEDDNLS